MAVDAYALTTLIHALEYLGINYVRTVGLSLYCTDGTATAATCEVLANNIDLVVTAGAGTHNIDLTLAPSDTLSEVVNIINAYDGTASWTANLLGDAGHASSNLVILPATGSLAVANTLTLYVADPSIVEDLINRASDMIESFCNRQFMSRAYVTDIYDGPDGDTLLLKQFPVMEVDRCVIGRADVIRVRNTIGDATRATVAVGVAAMTLTITGGTSAGTDTITWAANADLTAVVAAINAAVPAGKGWSAVLQSPATGVYVSTELLPHGGLACLNSDAHLDMPDPAGLSDFLVHWDEGMLERPGTSWGTGSRNIFVDYTAGYLTVPDDIEAACLELVAQLYHARDHDTSLKSEKLGDYAYTNQEASADSFPPNVLATCRRYMNRRL